MEGPHFKSYSRSSVGFLLSGSTMASLKDAVTKPEAEDTFIMYAMVSSSKSRCLRRIAVVMGTNGLAVFFDWEMNFSMMSAGAGCHHIHFVPIAQLKGYR